MILETLNCFVNDLRSVRSTKIKEELVKKYSELNNEDLIKLITYIYDYDKIFHITSNNFNKLSIIIDDKFKEHNLDISKFTIFDILDQLYHSQGGNYNIYLLNKYINENIKYKDLILNIIDKDLNCGIGETIISKYFPIKTFNVQLAETYKNDLLTNDWYISRKLDGVRAITIVDNYQNISIISRQGKEFTTLDNIKIAIKDICVKKDIRNIVFDGEICMLDDNENENFQLIMKYIRKKDYTIPNPVYYVFDILNLDDFNNGISNIQFSERLEQLYNIIDTKKFNRYIKALQQTKYDISSFEYLKKISLIEGWEGLMFKNGTSKYIAKRTKNMLKYKLMQDNEFTVIGIKKSIKTILINNENIDVKCIGSIIIDYEGNNVDVGSGISDIERIDWYNDPNLIIGKTVTIQYFEESINKNGNRSLRFPVFKGIREE